MDPLDPLDAQQIVVSYARLLERDLEAERHPARVDSLPYAKPIIKSAIATSVAQLARLGQLTDDMREYFETAYVSLAEYLEPELVDLLAEYRASADALTAARPAPADKMRTTAWRTVVETSALAGEVAQATTRDAESLRAEFRALVQRSA
jgi:hypothetical protein